MLCEECIEKPAVVHLIQVFNGQKTESHLCEDCASQKSGLILDSAQNISIPNLLGGMFGSIYNLQDVQAPTRPSKCPNCGMSLKDIRRLGKLGCSECYQVYAQELEATLRRIQGNSQHLGKIPVRGGEKVLIRRQIENLKNRLQEAVREEQYEQAAEIRDSLKVIERKRHREGSSG
jgi:protein arginine kinase activator